MVIEGASRFTVRVDVQACDESEPCQRGFCLPPLEVEVEPNDDPDEAQPVGDGSWVGADFAGEDDVDFFAVELQAGERLTLSTEAGCDADTVFMLFEAPMDGVEVVGHDCGLVPEEALLCADDTGDGECALATWTAESSGTYLVRVHEHETIRPWPTDEPHAYVLKVGLD